MAHKKGGGSSRNGRDSNAKRRGGTWLDIAQYAGSYALAFGIVGLFVTVFVMRG